jgi:putative PIN family toxin of toxin-antitoxin system
VKVVLDTNVLVSGILFSGPPHRILQAWSKGRLQLALTSELLEEYRRVGVELQQEYPGVDIGAVLDLIVVGSEFFEPAPLEGRVCSDPDDDKFVACAIASGAKVVVSGDRHLLHVSGYRGITVILRSLAGRQGVSG